MKRYLILVLFLFSFAFAKADVIYSGGPPVLDCWQIVNAYDYDVQTLRGGKVSPDTCLWWDIGVFVNGQWLFFKPEQKEYRCSDASDKDCFNYLRGELKCQKNSGDNYNRLDCYFKDVKEPIKYYGGVTPHSRRGDKVILLRIIDNNGAYSLGKDISDDYAKGGIWSDIKGFFTKIFSKKK